MLTYLGIKLLDLHLASHGAFVLGRGVEVAGSGTGHESNFIAHDILPYTFRHGHVCQPVRCLCRFINDTHAVG